MFGTMCDGLREQSSMLIHVYRFSTLTNLVQQQTRTPAVSRAYVPVDCVGGACYMGSLSHATSSSTVASNRVLHGQGRGDHDVVAEVKVSHGP